MVAQCLLDDGVSFYILMDILIIWWKEEYIFQNLNFWKCNKYLHICFCDRSLKSRNSIEDILMLYNVFSEYETSYENSLH